MSLYSLPCLFLLHKFLVMSETYLIFDTSKYGWKIVHVAMMKMSLVPSRLQYKFALDLIILRYSDFTIISPAFMTCLSAILLSCNTYGYDNNLTT